MILCIKKVFKMFISVNTSSLSHTGDTLKDLCKSVFVAALFVIRKKAGAQIFNKRVAK